LSDVFLFGQIIVILNFNEKTKNMSEIDKNGMLNPENMKKRSHDSGKGGGGSERGSKDDSVEDLIELFISREESNQGFGHIKNVGELEGKISFYRNAATSLANNEKYGKDGIRDFLELYKDIVLDNIVLSEYFRGLKTTEEKTRVFNKIKIIFRLLASNENKDGEKDNFKTDLIKDFEERVEEILGKKDTSKEKGVSSKNKKVEEDSGNKGNIFNKSKKSTSADNKQIDEAVINDTDYLKYKKYSLYEIISEFFKEESKSQKESSIKIALEEKLDEKSIKEKFINIAKENQETAREGEKRFNDFKELVLLTFDLEAADVLSNKSIDTESPNAYHKELIKALGNASEENKRFNKNDLVNSIGIDTEMYSENMGVIQKIVYASYQELKKDSYGKYKAKTGHKITESGNFRDRAGRVLDKNAFSKFSYNNSFTSDTVKELFFDFIPKLNSIKIVDEENHSTRTFDKEINIRKDLEKFPEECRELILLIGRLKASRDDIGGKATVFHYGMNKGAEKNKKGGENAKITGYLAKAPYDIGKNDVRGSRLATLGWVNIFKTQMLNDGRPRNRDDKDISEDNEIYKKWNVLESIQNAKTVKLAGLLDNWLEWSVPGWKQLDFKKYVPKRWDHDFPSIDRLTNGEKKAADYEESKEAFLEIINKANMAVDPDEIFKELNFADGKEIGSKVLAAVKKIGTLVSKVSSFVGSPEEDNPYNYVCEMEEAAIRFYILGVLLAVPGRISIFDSSEYESNYFEAVGAIEEYLNSNDSLDAYKDSILEFLEKNPGKKRFLTPREIKVGKNVFHAWDFRNFDIYKKFSGKQRSDKYELDPSCPIQPGNFTEKIS
jgi:hypothetical protein